MAFARNAVLNYAETAVLLAGGNVIAMGWISSENQKTEENHPVVFNVSQNK